MIDFTTGELAQTACIWEACARKVGNVHRGADFANTALTDFLLSGAVIGPVLQHAGNRSVGATVFDAVERTQAVVGQNTNLGIILLLAPLAAEWSGMRPGVQVADILKGLTTDDTRLVYEAIRLANPGGLGGAPEQDVREEPTVTLLEAMKLAAERDMIARQYANGFADVFDFGVPTFTIAFAKFGSVEAAIVDSQLRWLAAHPDSLIARKNGAAVTEDVQRRAQAALALGGLETSAGRAAGVALDRHLRSDGNRLNPGTTADLITACLFVALRENMVTPSAPFRWNVSDWL
ncbi:triphosphoribosyl-dephospho-CoA synthase [Gemmata obscuriglobus]|uniref:Triphosphoribosyl-dephospho-CoA synthetase n=1 Tax=Gemmata obscuriglobus TaxID=114 RepID=A0A2Z3H0L9_9BACT|nr:triphosphoribosyl-dephospho-CoA synthase [Gemmata obscuriglobus]AWM36675.1 triphosphoribosyl-dephospho-CoA synthetase [Gemmata obscuriglobus]QEG30684.1 triphosphoribosyl-dephospho-CoA synthase [Gemmata obscuriglobus]VTS10011.1 triphosphoribosyl-dephospho- protein : Triphosphoribosyl-dephospho-CoA synthase OS=Gemmata sp. Wa1-1 PE=4 SV=1: CitG [Gemmata obscuriglobus UQM 2246]